MHKHLWFALLFAVAAALMLINCGDDGPTQPTKNPPDITSFTATPSDIIPGDSVTLSYTVSNATQTRLYPGGQLLASATSGSVKVGPQVPTLYALVATNADGKDSAAVTVTMSAVVPSITQFDLVVDTILIGDSTQLSWQALRADSIVVNNGIGKLADAMAGTRYVKPMVNTSYRAIAYNEYGSDTATVTARVEVPATVDAPNGVLYKGVLSGAAYTPALKFSVRDAQGQLLFKPWIKFRRVTGDGTLTADSLKPDNSGSAAPVYTLSDSTGNAILRAIVPGVDSIEVAIRADVVTFNKIVPQVQYVLCGDSLGMVKALNGPPLRIDIDPISYYTYAVYETSLHLVFTIRDENQDEIAQDVEPVSTIIMTQGYAGKSQDSIGIGSTIADVQALYGTADAAQLVTDSLPYVWKYRYIQEGLLFWTTNTDDRTIFEIHVSPASSPAAPANRPYAYPSPDLMRGLARQEKAR